MKRGVATFTLDTGHCPPWLFQRMVKLGREMTRVLIEEYGPDEFVKRIADPVWFQSLGTVLAFDWNASGLTTILTAALREAIEGHEREYGVFICGGKGKTSRKTPDQIIDWGSRIALPESMTNNLVYNSKMSAKVDSALIQDGFQLYHHAFFFSKNGAWAVVQQGMNTEKGAARRYHWYSEDINDLIVEPHKGIVSPILQNSVLNMTARASDKNRQLAVQMLDAGYKTIMSDIHLLRRSKDFTALWLARKEFSNHPVEREDFAKSRYLEKIFAQVTEAKPKNYEEFVSQKGVGPKTIRALALVGEVIYGAAASYEDPARYSFAHGGKDATPYPVDRVIYDETIATLRKVVSRTQLSPLEKGKVLDRLPL